MTQLYVLADEYRAAAETLSNLDLDAQTIADTLEGLSGELEQKATATAMVVRNMTSLAAQIKDAESAMASRRKALEARAEHLTKYLHDCMVHSGKQVIECPYFAMTIKKNPPAVVITAPDLIPEEFMKKADPPPPAPDKAAIKKAIEAALKEEKDFPGAHLSQGTRLEIR